MNFDAYNALSEDDQEEYQSHRICPECNAALVYVDGHSTGDLHVMCPKCRMCPDCEDGE